MPLVKGRNAPQNIFLETLANKFDGSISNFVLGNAQRDQDYPIVYCSDGFCQLTGYTRSEVMRKSCCCKFLFGIDTEKDVVYKLTKALQTQAEMKAEVILYKKNGAPFWCLLDLMPIKNENAEVVLFLVSHKDITKSKATKSDGPVRDPVGNGSISEAPVPRFRKFSRDVLLHIQRQYSGKAVSTGKRGNAFPTSASRVGESSSFIPQYKLENAKLPRFMILHFGRPRLIWDWIILILVCYIAIMVPFNVAFKAHDHRKQLIIADCIVEIFFIVDIFINFRTTYIDKKSGRIITQKKLIAKHYLKSWFIVDFLAALPFEALYFIDHSWGFLVSLLKTGRLLRLFRVARRISRYIEYTAALLGLLMFSFAMLGHWFACVWYVIGYEEFQSKEMNGWLYGLGDQMGKPYRNNSLATGPSKGEAYISSLYFILTSLTTVGFGNIAPNTAAEKVFSVVVLLLGALMQSAIFGNMTAVIQKLYAVRARFHAKAAEIKQFVRLHRIENDLKRRIEDFFLTHWSVSKGVDSDEMLESFPSELRADICLHMYKNFLSIPCFSDASRGCWRLLSLKVKRAYFGPGELILKERDAIDAIFFVNSGTIEIVQKDCIVAILGSGDLFGDDVSRRTPIRRSNGDVRALTYCDLLYLTRDNFLGVVHLYPDFAESFSQKLEMTFNLGMKERDLSACGALDSITEGDEEEEEEEEEGAITESADEDNQEDSSLLQGAVSSPSPPLPLWQQKLRSRERGFSNPMTVSPTLEERLMRISNDSDSDSSDIDNSEKREYPATDGKQNVGAFHGIDSDINVGHFEMNRFTELNCTATSSGSESRSIFPQEPMKETSFYDTSNKRDDGLYLERAENSNATQVQMNTVLNELASSPVTCLDITTEERNSANTSQEQLLNGDDTTATIIDNPYFMTSYEYESGSIDDHSDLTSKEIPGLIEDEYKVPSIMCRNHARHRYSLPELTVESVTRYNNTARRHSKDMRRSSSFSNSRKRNGGILRKSRLFYEKSDIFEPLPEDHPILNNDDVVGCTTQEKRNSTSILWNMIGNSQRNGETSSMKSLENDTEDGHFRQSTKTLQLPVQNIERMSSGIFSRDQTDTDSDSESSNYSNNQRGYERPRQTSVPNGTDQGPLVLDAPEGNVATRKVRTRRFSSIDRRSPASSNCDAEYISEMRFELPHEGRSVRKSLDGIEKALISAGRKGTGITSIGSLAGDVNESKTNIDDVLLKIDSLSNDVVMLKKEVRSLTALVRLLVEQQNSLR